MDNFYSEDNDYNPVSPVPLVDLSKMKHRNMGYSYGNITCKCGFKCRTQTEFTQHIETEKTVSTNCGNIGATSQGPFGPEWY